MSKKTSLFSCCFTSEQLTNLEQNVARYNLEASAVCNPLFSLAEKLQAMREQNPELLEMIAKKRLATLKRLECKRFLCGCFVVYCRVIFSGKTEESGRRVREEKRGNGVA